MEFIKFDLQSRTLGEASSPERLRSRPGHPARCLARPSASPQPTPGGCRLPAAQCHRGGGAESGAPARDPETCVRVPGLECGGERPPEGRKWGAVTRARPRSPSEAGRGVKPREWPRAAAGTAPARAQGTRGRVGEGFKLFRAGVAYAATTHKYPTLKNHQRGQTPCGRAPSLPCV